MIHGLVVEWSVQTGHTGVHPEPHTYRWQNLLHLENTIYLKGLSAATTECWQHYTHDGIKWFSIAKCFAAILVCCSWCSCVLSWGAVSKICGATSNVGFSFVYCHLVGPADYWNRMKSLESVCGPSHWHVFNNGRSFFSSVIEQHMYSIRWCKNSLSRPICQETNSRNSQNK